MVTIVSLVVPIFISAVIVFVVSAIIHMVTPFHRNDLQKLPKEDEIMDALRRFNVPPGDYVTPYAGSPAAMKDPAFVEKRNKGPVMITTVLPAGPATMGSSLILWFIYSMVVSVFSGYLASRALMGQTPTYLEVFRFAGTAAFMGYSMALLNNSIWYRKNWGATIRSMIDGLLYALLTAGTFGWWMTR